MFTAKPKSPDNVVKLKNGTYFKISKIIQSKKHGAILEGHSIKLLRPAFFYPSWEIFVDRQIFTLDDSNSHSPKEEFYLRDVQCKSAIFKILDGESFIMPLLH